MLPSPSVACRKELILIDRHVLLVFFHRFTILEIRKRELKFHHRFGIDVTSFRLDYYRHDTTVAADTIFASANRISKECVNRSIQFVYKKPYLRYGYTNRISCIEEFEIIADFERKRLSYRLLKHQHFFRTI